MSDFKEMLKFYRTEMKLSQRELAKILELSPSAIGMYESGERCPSFEIEEKIADFFNVSLDSLRGRTKKRYSLFNCENE